MEFETFGKIARWNREICVTEKIDGTNAQVLVVPEGIVIYHVAAGRYFKKTFYKDDEPKSLRG